MLLVELSKMKCVCQRTVRSFEAQSQRLKTAFYNCNAILHSIAQSRLQTSTEAEQQDNCN